MGHSPILAEWFALVCSGFTQAAWVNMVPALHPSDIRTLGEKTQKKSFLSCLQSTSGLTVLAALWPCMSPELFFSEEGQHFGVGGNEK